MEGDRIDAARERAAGRREGEVVGAREAGDPVEQDHDVPPALDEPLRPLQRGLGHACLLLDGVVEGGGDDLGVFDRTAPVRDFLGSLTD